MPGRAAQDAVAEGKVVLADRAPEEVDYVIEHARILAYRPSMEILTHDELRNSNNSLEFEGRDHGDSGASFFLLNAAPGRGPSLHTHEYAEICIVLEGRATFRDAEGEREVSEGHVVVVAAGEPHAFFNSGDGPLRQLNIHANPQFVTEWLEEEADG
jgi:mannose-6-phosphate isomerase-like protein (cupin superfamily)